MEDPSQVDGNAEGWTRNWTQLALARVRASRIQFLRMGGGVGAPRQIEREGGTRMAQSQNSSVYYTEKATSFHGLGTYGTVMLGNKAFEFYNEKNPEDYIQIPWDQINYVAASVLFGGKKIARFAIFTKGSESGFSFSTRNNKATLRAMREHVPEDKLLRSLSFFDVIKQGVLSLFRKKR